MEIPLPRNGGGWRLQGRRVGAAGPDDSAPAGISPAGALSSRTSALPFPYSRVVLKVSHWRMSPLSKPRRNQRARCSEVPCVKLSGTTRPWLCF